jgi:DNA recombination protein RmuC
VVIDAKAPLNRFLEASEHDDPAQRRRLLDAHGKAVLGHATALRRRDYSDMVDGAVDLVVMFIPGEAFLAAAYEAEPSLLEDGLAHDVLIASPTSLMGLLRAIAHGWREERMAEQAERIATLGRELHDRIGLVLEHVTRTGAALDRAVEAHNATIGSVEKRLLPTARRLEDMHARSSRELRVAEPIAGTVRKVTAEVVRPADDGSGGPAGDAAAAEAAHATVDTGEGTDAVRELRPASGG